MSIFGFSFCPFFCSGSFLALGSWLLPLRSLDFSWLLPRSLLSSLALSLLFFSSLLSFRSTFLTLGSSFSADLLFWSSFLFTSSCLLSFPCFLPLSSGLLSFACFFGSFSFSFWPFYPPFNSLSVPFLSFSSDLGSLLSLSAAFLSFSRDLRSFLSSFFACYLPTFLP